MPRAATVLCIVLVSAAAHAQPRLAPANSIPPAELEAFVDGVVNQAMAAAHIAGATVSVVQDGRRVLNKGYGFADLARRQRVDPDSTLFRIGSITKTFTWIAVLNAVAAEHLRLDDPVNSHLPPDLQIPHDGFTQPIRIRDLMAHSGGFEDRMFGHLFVNDPARIRPLRTYLRDERPRRVRDPGIVHSYSNYGTSLAGAVLEHLRGEPWQDIIERDILHPLQMQRTSVREPYPARSDLPAPISDLAPHLSTGYRWTGTAHEAQPFEFITHNAPAGAISSSAGDMARYMAMLLAGGVLDGATVIAPTAAALGHPLTRLPPEVGNWNAGFLEGQLPGGFRGTGHDGGSLLFFSEMLLVPELRLGVFVSTNTAGGDALSGTLPTRIVERFYAQRADGPRPAAPALVAAAREYNGFYLQTRRAYTGVQGFLWRLLARRLTVDPAGYLVAGLMGPAQRFVPGDTPGTFIAAEPSAPLPAIAIARDDHRAVRIATPFMAFERVPFLMQPPLLLALAAATVVAAVGSLLGTRVRLRRDVSRTRAERAAAWLHTASAAAWIAAVAAFAVFAAAALSDESVFFYGWPPASLLVFSTAALLASLVAAALLVAVALVWRGAPGGWSRPRKIRVTAAATVFAATAGMLAWWGALQPWNP